VFTTPGDGGGGATRVKIVAAGVVTTSNARGGGGGGGVKLQREGGVSDTETHMYRASVRVTDVHINELTQPPEGISHTHMGDPRPPGDLI
jgi:hypothetical protein